ncbi:MAG: hypothetical protein HEQ37_14830 [Acidovorax sp.]|nr:hypothetical protein [Acidovorax sp.]
MAIVYVGIDLAQNGFALHGVNEVSKAKLVRLASIAWLLAEIRHVLRPIPMRTTTTSRGFCGVSFIGWLSG